MQRTGSSLQMYCLQGIHVRANWNMIKYLYTHIFMYINIEHVSISILLKVKLMHIKIFKFI